MLTEADATTLGALVSHTAVRADGATAAFLANIFHTAVLADCTAFTSLAPRLVEEAMWTAHLWHFIGAASTCQRQSNRQAGHLLLGKTEGNLDHSSLTEVLREI
jgi:hypothetical protein